ncbi:hypothetical protein D3C85_1646530 [compost metagenome]
MGAGVVGAGESFQQACAVYDRRADVVALGLAGGDGGGGQFLGIGSRDIAFFQYGGVGGAREGQGAEQRGKGITRHGYVLFGSRFQE